MIKFENQDLIIYGAGMVGNLVRQYLELTGESQNIRAFAVSDSIGVENYHGYKLTAIDGLKKYAKACTVLIATFPAAQEMIKNRLLDCGFENIVAMNYEMYQQMADTYISSLENKRQIKDNYDILYMASDNNKTSGAFLCLVDLAISMRGKGKKSLIVLPEYGNGEEILVEQELDYIYIPSKTMLTRIDGKEPTWQERNIADNSAAMNRIKELIYKHNIKIIHCNTTYASVGAMAAKEPGIPVMWHLRENIFEQGYCYKDKEEFYDLINSSSKVVVVSDYLKKCYPDLSKEKVVTIYDGVNVGEYYKEREIFSDTKVRIVLVAAIYPLKRQEDLIRAAVILKERGFDFQIDIIGSGEKQYIDKLEDIIRENNLGECVSLLGRKDEMQKYYQMSDISVVCSRSESFGRVCIESQLSGCVVVGASAGATKELIEDKKTGLLYECENAVDLAEKISYAILHPLESRVIAKNGQKKALHFFSKENSANQIYDIYEELL